MATRPKEARCSSLPRIMACPASAQQTGPAIDVVTDAGQMGTAVHALLASRARNSVATPQILAEAYDVDAAELLRLADIGWEMRGQIVEAVDWDQIPPVKTSAEIALNADLAPGLRLTGHLDYLIEAGALAIVPDYKAGRRGDLQNPEHQIKGYLWLVLTCFPGIQRATGVALWLHERATTTYQMSRAEADAWRDELVDKLTDPIPKYGPSESTCRYCPYQAMCPARLDLLSGALTIIDGTLGGGITPSRLLQAYEATSAIEARLKHFRTDLRAQIFRDGPIVADGKQLSLQEAAVSEIDPQRAWPVIAAHLSEDELAKCVKLRKGELVKAVRSKVTKGKKAAEDQFMHELGEQNAVTYITQQRLTLKTTEEE